MAARPKLLAVRPDFLYKTDQGYIGETTESVELYDGAFLQMYGRGMGTVRWGETEGTIEWTNFPPRRPDGVFLPDISGVIKLEGTDHPIMYRMRGISLLPDENNRRLFAGPVRWFTDHPDLLWLNDRWGYEEGELRLGELRFATRAFVIHAESPL